MTAPTKLDVDALIARLEVFATEHSLSFAVVRDAFERAASALRAQEDEIVRLTRETYDAGADIEAQEAIAAGDGTLHGAIDYWQKQTKRAEIELEAARKAGKSLYDASQQLIVERDARNALLLRWLQYTNLAKRSGASVADWDQLRQETHEATNAARAKEQK